MRRTCPCSLLLLAVWAHAGQANVQWRADYDEALREARLRNVPVLLVLQKDDAVSAAVASLASYLNGQVVTLIAHQETTHGARKRAVYDPRTGKTVQRDMCTMYPTVACAQHAKLYLRVWQQGGAFSKASTVPACFVLDPSGKILQGPGEGVDAGKSASVKAALEKARRALGPGVPMRLYARVRQTTDAALLGATQRRARRGITAIRRWIAVFSKRKLPTMVAGLKETLSDIDMQGHLLLDQAAQATDPAKARSLRLLVQKEFASLDSAREATKALGQKQR